jgi:hypothetical protein
VRIFPCLASQVKVSTVSPVRVKELWKKLKTAYVDFKERRLKDPTAPVIPPLQFEQLSMFGNEYDPSSFKNGYIKVAPSELTPDSEKIKNSPGSSPGSSPG